MSSSLRSSTARFRRPPLTRSEPLRGIGQLYRVAEGPGSAIGGVPLSSAEDAVVAAVRMGYRVAQTHVDKAARITDRLRDASERAVGPEPERQAIDATERLVGKALLTGLEWLEGAASEPGNPLRRYASAQYKLLGALLGLSLDKDVATGGAPRSAEPTSASATAAPPEARRERTLAGNVSVMHRRGARRPVLVRALHFDVPIVEGEFDLPLFGGAKFAKSPHSATLVLTPGEAAVLQITTAARGPSAIWRAAICTPKGEQLGWIELEV